MNQVRSRLSRSAAVIAAAFIFSLALGVGPALAKAPMVFNGIVRHVSADNIKVYDPKADKTMGFAIAPKFHNVFKSGGKTTQLSTIAAGQYVKVYYDRKLLGLAHADKIYLLDQGNHAYARQ